MDMSKMPLFQAITQRMKWLHKSQEVVARNIAQADTPGYRAKRMKDQDFTALLDMADDLKAPRASMPKLGRVQMAQAPSMTSDADPVLARRLHQEEVPMREESPDGNSVVLEEELLEMAQIQMDYGLMTNLYRRHMSMLRTALGKNNG